MFLSIAKQATSVAIRRSVVKQQALFATQLCNYAAKGKGGKAKGKTGGKKELKSGFQQIPNRYAKTMPEDPLTPVTVPKISMSLMRGTTYVVKNVRLDKIECETVEEGYIAIYPNMRNSMYRLQPGLVQVCILIILSLSLHFTGIMH
jgi:hypothetical protein